MKEGKLLKNKIFLYMTEFFSGMSVMAVELGASRLLAPYFSSSQIVWTIIIGTIMIAMALGNLWGGKMADKDPNPDRLYIRLLIAAVWIAVIPFAGKYVILGITFVLAMFVSHNFLIWAAFTACMILFVFPLLLLGTVTPSLAKYTVENLEENGKTVGTLGALNTIGSIIGTFTPTFVTIPAVGTAVTFLIFAGILLVLAVCYFAGERAKKIPCIAAGLLFAVCCMLGSSKSFAFWEDGLLYEGESIYNYLQVKEQEDSVILSTNVMFGVQSVMMKEKGLTGMYYDYALAAPLMAGALEKKDASVLILGMGTGTYAKQCLEYFPAVSIEGVEIDEKIAGLAKTYFELPGNMEISIYDGRAYLAASEKKYDVIMVDAYQDITIPFQMSSVEFFTLVKEHLTEDGVMVVNLNMHSDLEGSINEYLSDTIASVFPEVLLAQVPYSTNIELFAGKDLGLKKELQGEIGQIPDAALKEMMERVCSSLTLYTGKGKLLTDDKAPVEMLGMRVIDEIISRELDGLRNAYKEGGLKKVLQSL